MTTGEDAEQALQLEYAQSLIDKAVRELSTISALPGNAALSAKSDLLSARAKLESARHRLRVPVTQRVGAAV